MSERCAFSLPAALILAGRSLPFAVIESAADVFLGGSLARVYAGFIRRALFAAAGQNSGRQTTDGSGGEFMEPATIQEI
jgi:hypothetical protein